MLSAVSAPDAAVAEDWQEIDRRRVWEHPGVLFLDRDFERRSDRHIRVRAKFVFDEVQVLERSTLRYRELRTVFEVNCVTTNFRHILSTLYSPGGNILQQVEGNKVPLEPDVKAAREICARAN